MSVLKRVTTGSGVSDDFKVAVNSSDSNEDFLRDKMYGGDNISLSTYTDDGVLKVKIDASDASTTLTALTDVDTSPTPSTGDVLAKASGGEYEFITPTTTLAGLTDTDLTPVDGKVLTYKSGTAKYELETPIVYDTYSVTELTSDTTLTAPMATNYTLTPSASYPVLEVEMPLLSTILGTEITFTLTKPTYGATTDDCYYARVSENDSDTAAFYESGTTRNALYLTVVGESITIIATSTSRFDVVRRSYPTYTDPMDSLSGTSSYRWRNYTHAQLNMTATSGSDVLTVYLPASAVNWDTKSLNLYIKISTGVGEQVTVYVKSSTGSSEYYTRVIPAYREPAYLTIHWGEFEGVISGDDPMIQYFETDSTPS